MAVSVEKNNTWLCYVVVVTVMSCFAWDSSPSFSLLCHVLLLNLINLINKQANKLYINQTKPSSLIQSSQAININGEKKRLRVWKGCCDEQRPQAKAPMDSWPSRSLCRRCHQARRPSQSVSLYHQFNYCYLITSLNVIYVNRSDSQVGVETYGLEGIDIVSSKESPSGTCLMIFPRSLF